MTKLEFFSLTTDERLEKKWTQVELKGFRDLLCEAVYRRAGSTTIPPKGYAEEDVCELRQIVDLFAQERYGETTDRRISDIRDYFNTEISVCWTNMGYP